MDANRLHEGQELTENETTLMSAGMNPSATPTRHSAPKNDEEDESEESSTEGDSEEEVNEDDSHNTKPRTEKPSDGLLHLKMSESLHRKLVIKAQQEGVPVNDFAVELLAEGLVLRAWEIMERKQHTRGDNRQGNQQQQQGRPHGNNRYRQGQDQKRGGHQGGGGGGGGRRGMSQSRYNTLMEDKAEFLEYVRNQEKKQR